MKIKMKTMKVVGPSLHPTTTDPNCYRVQQVTDCTTPVPGSVLTERELHEFCVADDWKVVIGLP